jgi:O-antigen/teichoic acid export membrane protein
VSARTRGLGANASLVLAGDAVAKAGMFVALLVLAHTMTVAEYARLGIAMAAMLIATSVLDGGVGIVAVREGASDPERRLPLLYAGGVARGPLAAGVAAVLLAAGLAVDELALALAVLAAALVNAAQLALFATFRSAQNLLNEALAKGFCGIAYPAVCLGVSAAGYRSAFAAMLALAVPPLVTLPLLVARARRGAGPRREPLAALPLLRRSLPFALIAVVTLLYYRAPVLLMGILSTHAATASYAVAANIGFGLLMIPAAVATGLLPKLAAETDNHTSVRLVRRALVWTMSIVVAVNLAVAGGSIWLVPVLYGDTYRSALAPLLVLLASGVVIGAAGIVGTALVAMGRRRDVVRQVLLALAVNVVAAVVLIPALAAEGAALATLLTELVSLAILSSAFARCTASGLSLRPASLRRHRRAVTVQ